MPPLDNAELEQLLADISAAEEASEERGPRRVSVIQIERTEVTEDVAGKCSEADTGGSGSGRAFTSTLGSYAYSLIQVSKMALEIFRIRDPFQLNLSVCI